MYGRWAAQARRNLGQWHWMQTGSAVKVVGVVQLCPALSLATREAIQGCRHARAISEVSLGIVSGCAVLGHLSGCD